MEGRRTLSPGHLIRCGTNANPDHRDALGYGRDFGLGNYMGIHGGLENYLGGGLGGQRTYFSRLGGGLGNMGSMDFGGFGGMRVLGFGMRGRGMSGGRRRQALV